MGEVTPQSSTPPVLTIEGSRALIRLNRPAVHNRLEPADLKTLLTHFTHIGQEPHVRSLILTGTGTTFSSGFDLGALAERGGAREPDERGQNDPNLFSATVDALETLGVPTIAALNGSVYGGATDLALACDFRIGVTGMKLMMPAAKLGICYYESGLRRYVTRLGLNAAKRLFLTAQAVDTGALLAMGYLSEAVPPDQLMARAETLAGTLAANAPLAMSAMKRALNELAGDRLDQGQVRAAMAVCAASADHAEGLAAWAQKRPPVFHGN